jgi:hypothetical protein
MASFASSQDFDRGVDTGAFGVRIELPSGNLSVRVTDMVLRSGGGEQRWLRTWDGQEWKLQPQRESFTSSQCSSLMVHANGNISVVRSEKVSLKYRQQKCFLVLVIQDFGEEGD